MLKLTWQLAKKKVLPGLFAAALSALFGLAAGTAVEAASAQLWSIVVHIEYQDGFEYDYVIARGVSTTDMPDYLAACGRAHMTEGTVVLSHCYVVPE